MNSNSTSLSSSQDKILKEVISKYSFIEPVLDKFHMRSYYGRIKYERFLHENDKPEDYWINAKLEELMDFLMYDQREQSTSNKPLNEMIVKEINRLGNILCQKYQKNQS